MGPLARNRVDDVRRVETAIDRTGLLDRTPGGGVFDSFLDIGIRNFQRKNGLKQDGLLKPKGPTEEMLNQVAAKQAGKEEPDKDKDNKDCTRLKAELANAEQAAKEAAERMRKAADVFNQKSREVEARWREVKRQAVAFGINNIATIVDLRKGKIPRGVTLPSDVLEAWQAYQDSLSESKRAIEEQKAAQADFDAREAEAAAIRKMIKESGCG